MNYKTCFVIAMICLLTPDSHAGDQNNQKMRQADSGGDRVHSGGQKNLSKNVEPHAPKQGSDAPGKNTHLSGHQNGYRPVQMHGGQNKGPAEHGQSPDRPTGGPSWLKDRHKNDKHRGGVDQFGRDAQLTKIADPTGGFKEFSGKDHGIGNRLSDAPRGARGLTGGSSSPNFPATTVSRGYGKNAVSKKSEQGMFANTQLIGTDVPTAPVVENSGTSNPILYPSNVMFVGQSDKKISTEVPASKGDNAGTAPAVASGNAMENVRPTTANFTVVTGGSSATKVVPTHRNVNVLDTPNPDAADDNHVPDSVKNLSTFGQKDPKDDEEERKRWVTQPGEGGTRGGLRRDDIQVTPQDMLTKRTDNRTRPVDGDGTTTNVGAGTNPDVDIDPLTGQPKKGKTHGGGGDPLENNG